MAITTPMQSLPLPEDTDDPAIPDDMMSLALAIEKKLVGVYNNTTDRGTRVTSPVEGQVAYLKDTNSFTFWTGSAWTLMFPAQVAITTGSTVPSNSVGNNGDLFLKTA